MPLCLKMAEFFADSDDEKALKELLSEAIDAAILEQVAAINNAGFKNSYLPSHLETRFQNLKSFQSSTTKPATSLPTQSFNLSHSSQFKKNDCVDETKKKFEQRGKWSLSPTKSSDSESFSPAKKIPRRKFWEGFSRFGRFLCSLNEASRRKSNKNGRFDSGIDRRKHDEFLSDLSNFSVKNQQKMMKAAMEEEEKICREAEKIVNLVNHASAGMDVSDIYISK